MRIKLLCRLGWHEWDWRWDADARGVTTFCRCCGVERGVGVSENVNDSMKYVRGDIYDALLAERDGLLRQREFDEQRYEAMCIERDGLRGDLAVALAERDALREAGDALAKELLWWVDPADVNQDVLAAWRAATGESSDAGD